MTRLRRHGTSPSRVTSSVRRRCPYICPKANSTRAPSAPRTYFTSQHRCTLTVSVIYSLYPQLKVGYREQLHKASTDNALMLIPDLKLSRRLEIASAQCDADYVTAIHKLNPESKASAERLSAGYAVFLGKPFPVNHATGLGLSGIVDVDEVERIEAFYSERDMPTKVHLSPLADASLFACLGERRYKVDRFFTVYARELSAFV